MSYETDTLISHSSFHGIKIFGVFTRYRGRDRSRLTDDGKDGHNSKATKDDAKTEDCEIKKSESGTTCATSSTDGKSSGGMKKGWKKRSVSPVEVYLPAVTVPVRIKQFDQKRRKN